MEEKTQSIENDREKVSQKTTNEKLEIKREITHIEFICAIMNVDC